MAGIKIINVLKDDTFEEILTMFRGTDAGEVIFVLPKKSRVFKREDHFAAFAAEAKGNGKTISILCANPDMNAWAKRYGFSVMQAKPLSPGQVDGTKVERAASSKTEAKLASYSDDIPDDSDAAYDPNVPDTSDNIVPTSDSADDLDPLAGLHETDEQLEHDADKEVWGADDDAGEEPSDDALSQIEEEADLASAHGQPTATLAAAGGIDGIRSGTRTRVKVPARAERARAVPVAPATTTEALDYIDAVWRDKASREGFSALESARPKQFSRWMRWFRKSSPAPTPFGRRQISSRVPSVLVGGIVIAVLVLFGGVFYLSTGTAKLEIRPTSEALDISVTIKAAPSFASVDTVFGQIPGQQFRVTRNVSREFTASGHTEVAQKARGTITVSNAFSTTPQTLIATTRFTTPDGRVFRSLQNVMIPGGKASGGTIVPGTASVPVIADAPGAEYNVPATVFRIPAFKERGDMEKYDKITGASSAPMTGGANGPATVVTDDDYQKGVAAVTQDIRDQIATAFSAQTAGLTMIGSGQATISRPQSTAVPDQVAQQFTVSASGSLETIAFREEDVLAVIRAAVDKNSGRFIVPDKVKLTYGAPTLDPTSSVMTFTVSARGVSYAPLDTAKIARDIKGKSESAVRGYFKDVEGAGAISIRLSPFWISTVPANERKISIDIVYE